MSFKSALVGALALLGVAAGPAFAMNWIHVDPNEPRLWLDADTIATRDGYSYYTWSVRHYDDLPPPAAGGYEAAVNCTTGERIRLDRQIDKWVQDDARAPATNPMRMAVCARTRP